MTVTQRMPLPDRLPVAERHVVSLWCADHEWSASPPSPLAVRCKGHLRGDRWILSEIEDCHVPEGHLLAVVEAARLAIGRRVRRAIGQPERGPRWTPRAEFAQLPLSGRESQVYELALYCGPDGVWSEQAPSPVRFRLVGGQWKGTYFVDAAAPTGTRLPLTSMREQVQLCQALKHSLEGQVGATVHGLSPDRLDPTPWLT